MKKLYSTFLMICLLCSSIQASQPYYIGELGSAWEFPSDHLPVAATFGNVHIASWNILNKNYLFHINENTQGLRDSAIMRDHQPIDSTSLTLRERIVLQQILEMISHPTHPRSLIALEETHPDVLNALKEELPGNWAIATPPGQPQSQDIYLYNKEIFEIVAVDAAKYTPDNYKTIFSLTLREKATGETFRFIQSHIPGGPVDSPVAVAKYAKEAMRQFDPSLTIALMGDMNQSPAVIEKALAGAAKEAGLPFQPYAHLPIAYPSHVNTRLEASWIDNFFVYSPRINVQATNEPSELSSAVAPAVTVLQAATLHQELSGSSAP
ncbi:MAG: hypothetical protein LLG04_01745 [Parachlamydia sp.]|nr:hypothetical protein [Parachlamydia sp.]